MKHPKQRRDKETTPAATPVTETPAEPEKKSIKRGRRGLELALVAGALLVFLVLAVTSARRKSATFDEGAHIPAAYTSVALGDFRMNPEHPPLIKPLAGTEQFLQRLRQLTPVAKIGNSIFVYRLP